jgi:hypothetical protein
MKLISCSRGIETRYVGPTNTRGSRIKAIDGDRSVTIPYDYELSDAELHFKAVLALMKKYDMSWGNNWGYTCLEKGRGFIFFIVRNEASNEI